MKEGISEAETAMLLNVYMYTDYEYATDGMTLGRIVEDMPSFIDVNGTYHSQYAILCEAVKDPQIRDMVIGDQSRNMGYDSGTNAVTFTSADKKSVYVVYRGTADGEWMDNGMGLTQKTTGQQERAVGYFDEVISKKETGDYDRIIVTGHSKGGNKAQFVTMESDNAECIDACYSIDGQGQSKKAIDEWKERYGKELYDERTEKIYAINGQNDYVSVLGYCIVPASHIFYVRTDASAFDFAAYHDITRMFADFDPETGNVTYHARKNPYVFSRGSVADYISEVSKDLMDSTEESLKGCAFGAMQIPEIAFGGMLTGLGGEHALLKDAGIFLKDGIPIIAGNMAHTEAGNGFYQRAMGSKSMYRTFSSGDSINICYTGIMKEAQSMNDMAVQISDIAQGITENTYKLSFFYDRIPVKDAQIKLCTGALMSQKNAMVRLSKKLEKIADVCMKFENELI